MNRKLVITVAAAAMAAEILTGCGNAKDAGKPQTNGATLAPATSAPATSDQNEFDTGANFGPKVMHPNVLVDIKCGDNGQVSVSTLLINGTSDPTRQPISVEPVKPVVDAGWDCYFALEPKSNATAFVVANPLVSGDDVNWYFSETLTPTGLTALVSDKLSPGTLKGYDYRVYVQVKDLPTTDSFDSAHTWSGGTTAVRKNYNKRVDQMNGLKVNKIGGFSYKHIVE